MKMDTILLMAYVDGELSAEESQEVEKEIAVSPDAAEFVAQLQTARLPYADAFAQQKLPPVPDTLTKAIAAMAEAHAQTQRAATAGANDSRIEASPFTPPSAPVRSRLRIAPQWLAVAFVAGVFCYGVGTRFMPGVVGPNSVPATPATLAAANPDAASWVAAAAGYQQLYSRDTIAQVPVNADVTTQTVDEIQHQDGLNLRIPDLSADGLTFKRVQRLRFNDKPLVQIVYLPQQGAPIALCVMKEAKPDAAMAQQHIDSMNVVTWRHADLSYALIGKPEGTDLSALAKRISGSDVQTLYGEIRGEMRGATLALAAN
jgi:anti-sigma factor RsiW